MSTQKLISPLARICKHHFQRSYGPFSPSATQTYCKKSCTLLQPINISKTFPVSQISTSSDLYNDKKFGQFLFGRPPKPDLDANESSIEDRIEDVDPLSREILHKLHIAQTPSDLFKAFQENKLFMTEVHTSRALQQLAEIWDPHGENVPIVTNQNTSLITVEPDFRELCVRCLKDAQHMDDYTFLKSLHSLLKIGVPENSALIHTLLTHSSYRLDRMSAIDFAIFCWIVRSLKLSDELSHALNKAVVMIIPRMIPRTDQTWQLVAFLQVAGEKLSAETRGKLLNKLLALLKLNPSVTAEDCFRIVLALKDSNFQSKETLAELCRHLHEGFEELSNPQICQLIKALGQFKYVHLELMEKLTNHVCSLFEDGIDESVIRDVVNGMKGGRIHYPELTSLACKFVVETFKDEDLSVDVAVINSLTRYIDEINVRPVLLQEFVSSASEVYREFFSKESSMKELVNAIDGFYHLCLLNDLDDPCSMETFEERAAKFIERDTHRGKYFQNVVQRISMLRFLANHMMQLTVNRTNATSQLDCDLPNPWQAIQCHNLRSEKKLLQKVLEEAVGPDRLRCGVEICEGLKADFVLLPPQGVDSSDDILSERGGGKLAVNLLPREGHAANRSGHLVGLYHLKDRFMKHLEYETFWVNATSCQIAEDAGEEIPLPDHRMSDLKERLQRVL